MNILKHERTQIVALVESGLTRKENITHWDICNALAQGKTIEFVAEQFRLSSRNVDYIKEKKCKKCGG